MVLSIESQNGNWDIVNLHTGEVIVQSLNSQEAITLLRGGNERN